MAKQQRTPASIQGPRIAILLTTLALVLLGLVMVYSSSMVKAINAGDDPYSYVVRQAIYAAIGIAACLFIWKAPILRWLHLSQVNWVLWVIVVALLGATAFFGVGDEDWGAKRWLSLGSFSLQPSEFIKVALVVFMAYLYNEYRQGLSDWRQFLGKLLLMVIAPALVMYRAQSDLGTTIIVAVGILAVLWLGEAPGKVFLAALALGVAFVAFSVVGSDYRAGRFIYLNPWDDGQGGQGDGWQIIHSYWAFSEGGIFGVGLGNSYEKYLYLPMAETDFIFAIIGEELGLVGALLVMVLFAVLLFAGLRIAYAAHSSFSTMLAGAVIVMLCFQAFLNMGCAVGAFPTTGKPLPFISSGGSSMIASLMMVGLVLAVSDEASGPSEYDRKRENLRVVHANNASARGFSAQRGGNR
ncbi:MAG: putative lipid II flippase FtsW [Coriobacteriia bacterium]|nr:putative lipid II flippase FtsW [Coriobacteriia bacterium]